MAKINLGNIYSSSKYITVLGLLKALIEDVDGVDYTPASDFTTLSATVSTNTSNIDTNKTNISANTASISALNTKVESNKKSTDNNIATNTTNIATNATNITDVTNRVNKIRKIFVHEIFVKSINGPRLSCNLISDFDNPIKDADGLDECLKTLTSDDKSKLISCVGIVDNTLYYLFSYDSSARVITFFNEPGNGSRDFMNVENANSTITDSVLRTSA